MASIRFNLRDRKTPTVAVPLYVIVEHSNKRVLKYPTGIKVSFNEWNLKTQRVRKNYNAFEVVNVQIKDLFDKIDTFCKTVLSKNEILTGTALRNHLNGATNKHKTHNGTVCDFMRHYIENLPNQVNHKTGRALSKQTISKFICLRNVLLEMEKVQNVTFTFQNIDFDFYNSFTIFLQSKGFQPNTIGSKYIETLKTILNEAERQDVKVNKAYKDRKFATPSEEVFNIYLSVAEIEKLENLNLSENLRLERVRDLFLIGYYTGQRFGDFSTFVKEQFEIHPNGKEGEIKLLQNKTANYVTIPIGNEVITIMKKYAWKLPKISSVNFNLYIKEVCQLAAIDKGISQTKKIGNEEKISITPKYELVSSHTARRSFATNAYSASPEKVMYIMKTTGHKTEKEFMKYICFTSEENAQIMKNLLVKVPKASLLKAV